jgi:5-methylcytosine-specific restriction endonuclease McrA
MQRNGLVNLGLRTFKNNCGDEMPLIRIDNLVSFAPNVGVLVHRVALDESSDRLLEAIRTAYKHIKDEILVEACCGGRGPLSQYLELPFDEYLDLAEQSRVELAARKAKRVLTKVRRSSYVAKRAQLMLAMIEAKIPYVCAHRECTMVENLTIDHITPLSRGGTDELSNLQFLCRAHNSAKGDGAQANGHF